MALRWLMNVFYLAFAIGSINCLTFPNIPLPVLPVSGGSVNIIGQYNGSMDIEFPYFKNYTSFNVTAVELTSVRSFVFTFMHSNKGTLNGMPAGPKLIKIVGLTHVGCPLVPPDVNGNAGAVTVIENAPARVEIQNFKISYKLDRDMRIQFQASWDSVQNAKDYLVTWRRIEDCLPNESSMVTSKTDANIVIGGLNSNLLLDQLDRIFLFNVRVNSTVQNSIPDNKPKAQPIKTPINIHPLNISVVKRKEDSVSLYTPLDLENIIVKVNKKTYNFSGPGNLQIEGLTGNTSYEVLAYIVNDAFESRIFMEKFVVKTASIPIFNAVKSLNLCTDSRNIKLEWNATVPSHNYIIKYRKLGDLLEVSRKTENTTTEVLTCLQPNTTYRVIVEIESRPNAYKFDNPKPFEFTTGFERNDTHCVYNTSTHQCGKVSTASVISPMSVVMQVVTILISMIIFKQD